VRAVSRLTTGEVIAIDGKTARRSYDQGQGKGAIHIVSAWASQNRSVLGQRQVDEKANEITTIPELLKGSDVGKNQTKALFRAIATFAEKGFLRQSTQTLVSHSWGWRL